MRNEKQYFGNNAKTQKVIASENTRIVVNLDIFGVNQVPFVNWTIFSNFHCHTLSIGRQNSATLPTTDARCDDWATICTLHAHLDDDDHVCPLFALNALNLRIKIDDYPIHQFQCRNKAAPIYHSIGQITVPLRFSRLSSSARRSFVRFYFSSNASAVERTLLLWPLMSDVGGDWSVSMSSMCAASIYAAALPFPAEISLRKYRYIFYAWIRCCEYLQ